VLAVVAPGQGAQAPGFLAPWLAEPTVAERLRGLSAVLDMDLAWYGTQADADTIRDTAVAQPLLVAAGLATMPALLPEPDSSRVGVLAGHSVGELTAAAAAGVLTPEEALVLVAERGRAMAEAAAVAPTGMTAVLGGDPDDVLSTLDRHGLTPANVNGAGQVVAAGTTDELAALAADPPARARLVPLQVAGAFHTRHMAPAVDALRRVAGTVTPQAPRTPLLSNRDGAQVSDGAVALARLVDQVSNPVRWDLCMQTMAALGVTGLLELPPAGTLAGLAKRGLPGVATFALKTPDQLDDARAFVDRHAGAPALPTEAGSR
jgi:[acyl-carrier-protein] S-malonyltransferase